MINVTIEFAATLRKDFPPDSHKGTFGHAMIIGGSYGKIGAVILALRAALRSGCGLASCLVPECGYTAIQSSIPEAMVSTDENFRHISNINTGFKYDATAVGPGMGKDLATKKAFHRFLKSSLDPIVVDADALNIIAGNKSWLKLLPENSILTPHPKEWERISGKDAGQDELTRAMEMSSQNNLIIVLKGSPTVTVTPAKVYRNTTGNSRLATAGSGDVLTGIICGLLAQGYSSEDAAILGVFAHGLTADDTITEETRESFTASDIIKNLGKAFKQIESALK